MFHLILSKMKKVFLTPFLAFALLIFLASFSYQNLPGYINDETRSISQGVDHFPEDVAKILKVHCMDCHVTSSKNDKAKKKLNFDNWDKLNMLKKTGKLNDIVETVKDREMPPEKYINHYPDKKLSDEQIKTLVKWAEKTMDSFKE